MASPPKFIKYIVRPEADLLEIPDEFIRRCNSNLPRFVNFMVPTGSRWEIKVVKANDGKMFFGDGWETFRQYYFIGEGHFLVFDYYQKYNHFDVLIFQKGGAESRYLVEGQAGTSSDLSSHSFISVEPPKFCSVMCDLTRESLRIPSKFTKRFRSDLPGTVFLRVPGSSLTWKVELILELDGDIWMENGFEEFVDHYSIDVGQSLVFEYDGEVSCFEVLIFDMTSTEIQYAVADVEDASEREDSVDDDHSDEEGEMNIDASCELGKEVTGKLE